MRRFNWILWCCLALGLGNAQAQTQTLRIGAWEQDGNDMLMQTSAAVLHQAYAQLKQPVEFVNLPVRRALQMLLNEELDGNVYRIAGLSAEYPQLIQVDAPVGALQIRAYALERNEKISDWAQLRGLRIAYLRGVLAVERRLPQDAQRVEASDVHDMFKLLHKSAADMVLVLEPSGVAAHPSAVTLGISRLDGALGELPVHHYLLRRHSDIAQQLNGVLKKMQASGQMDAIRQKTLKRASVATR